jgi:hypothetical protein
LRRVGAGEAWVLRAGSRSMAAVSVPLRRAWIALIGLHLALLAYAFPLDVVFGDGPFGGSDYQTHYQHTHTLLQARTELGQAWVYDPNLLAGHPSGLIFDVDNKLHFGWCAALVRLGVPLPIAFNLFTLAAGLLAPVMLWLAARLLGMQAAARAAVFGLGVLVWNFDPTTRFCWGGGMISFAAAAPLCVLLVALLHRLLADGRRAHALAFALLLPLALRMHVWSFAVLVAPLTGLYLRACLKLPVRTHMAVWTAAALGLLVNLDWLLPALAHRGLIVPSAAFGQATPPFLIYDFLEQLVDTRITGIVVQRTLLRGLVLLAAAATWWMWRRAGDLRARAGGLTLVWLVGLTYCGALVPGVQATEPYRFAVPMVLWAAVLAGPWLVTAAAGLRGLSGAARGAVALLLLLLVPRVYQQVAPFIPELSPMPPPSGPAARMMFHGRMAAVSEDFAAVREWLQAQPDTGRVLVQHAPLGEYLRWASDRSVLGGFHDRRMIFQDADLFFFPPEDPRYDAGLAAYLERYNVAYVVMSYPHVPVIERRSDLLAPAGIQGGLHRVYRVRRPSGYFEAGSGEVSAGLNRIAVRRARPAPGTQALTLRFHHMDELRCRPGAPQAGGCRVERAEVPGDTAGFVRVVGEPTLPEAFVLELVY